MTTQPGSEQGSHGGGTSKRGFASMDAAKQREIASKGGRAAHAQGSAHEFTPEEASRAGRRAHESGNAHEFNSEEARAAGRKGGQSSRRNRAEQQQATSSGGTEPHPQKAP